MMIILGLRQPVTSCWMLALLVALPVVEAASEDKKNLLDLRRCRDCRRRCENFSDGEIADEDFTIMM